MPLEAGMACWPGDPPFTLEPVTTLEHDGVRTSRLTMASHTGTHIDAPAHFVAGGKGIDEIAPEVLVGPCWVSQLDPDDGCVEPHHLQELPWQHTTRVILRTASTRLSPPGSLPVVFDVTAPAGHLSAASARLLVERGVRLIGIDSLSIDAADSIDLPAHRILLAAGVVVVEGLVLDGVDTGAYTLLALPLRIRGGDGAPCRALLRPLPLP